MTTQEAVLKSLIRLAAWEALDLPEESDRRKELEEGIRRGRQTLRLANEPREEVMRSTGAR